MENAHKEHPKYMRIFWILLALTVAEVAVVYMPLPKIVIALLLIGMACSKALYVALYFMHLKFEKKNLDGYCADTVYYLRFSGVYAASGSNGECSP